MFSNGEQLREILREECSLFRTGNNIGRHILRKMFSNGEQLREILREECSVMGNSSGRY